MTTALTTTHRQRYLQNAIDQLFDGLQKPAQAGKQASIKLGKRSVSLEAWEFDALMEWHAAPSVAPAPPWRALVVEALALQYRFCADLDRLELVESRPGSAGDAARSDVQTNAVLAFQILSDLQRETEKLVVSGGMDQAKRLTQFRRRLNECLTNAGKLTGEAMIKEAEKLASQDGPVQNPERVRRTETQEERLQSLLALEEELNRREEMRPVRVPEASLPVEELDFDEPAPQRRPRIRYALIGILVVVVGLWIARRVMQQPQPAVRHELALDSFKSVAAIHEVISRAPSLFIVVDSAAWTSLTPGEQLDVVRQVASSAEASGYSGAVVRTTQGAIVGQWLKRGGPRLLNGT